MDFLRFNTPLREMAAAAEDGAVCRIWLPGAGIPDRPVQTSPLLEETASEICDYLMGIRSAFEVPVRLQGTAFQRSVWDVLAAIPCGEVRTYGEVARALGRPQAARAVGAACRANPVPILVPCHRVIAAGGRPGGYAGGSGTKRALLELEGHFFLPDGRLEN